jgi:hypothetical protein
MGSITLQESRGPDENSDGLSGEPEIAGFSRMSLNAASNFGEYEISESIRDHTIYLLLPDRMWSVRYLRSIRSP